MIAVNVNRSYKAGMSLAELLEIGAGEWAGIGDAALAEYAGPGETLVLVAYNTMVGAATITGATRGENGKITFDLTPDPARTQEVSGIPFPEPWVRGQARPVRYISTETIDAAIAASGAIPDEDTRPPRQEVSLDGFRLSIDSATGVATLVIPAGRDVTIAARRSR